MAGEEEAGDDKQREEDGGGHCPRPEEVLVPLVFCLQKIGIDNAVSQLAVRAKHRLVHRINNGCKGE